MADYVREVVRPKDLRLPPVADDPKDDATFSHMELEFLEYTLIRGWMEQWLKWVRWYAETGLNLSTPLLSFWICLITLL